MGQPCCIFTDHNFTTNFLESVKVRIDYPNDIWKWSCPQMIQAKFQGDRHPNDQMKLMTVLTPFPKGYYQG